MSFQGYLNNIEAKTGKTPDDFIVWGRARGFCDEAGLANAIKVSAIVAEIKSEFGLGHGHAMAIVALLKGKRS